jgi:ribonucleoside-diphosphate reductase alpha chain
MEIRRLFTSEFSDPLNTVDYELYDCIQTDWQTKKVKFEMRGVEVPKHWSKNARDILITKYFRRAGVPLCTGVESEGGIPHWLQKAVALPNSELGSETSVKQVVRRLAGHWTYTGFKEGYFEPSEEQIEFASASEGMATGGKPEPLVLEARIGLAREKNARAFHDEVVYMLLHQMAAPNSPQWFNTGLSWAYGITGKSGGHFYVDAPGRMTQYKETADWDITFARGILKKALRQTVDGYSKVQAHACFILDVEDKMCGEAGILDWYTREGRIFKYGSGSGANLSKLRATGENLSGGGTSSGVMSWMKTGDYNAGAIKSGGTTRRAAAMRILNVDHPDILEFINCKLEAEVAVASLVVGSAVVNDACQRIMDAKRTALNEVVEAEVDMARERNVPENFIVKAIGYATAGVEKWPGQNFDTHFEGKAYGMVPWQNANNSVRLTAQFYEAVDKDLSWDLVARKGGGIMKTLRARELERLIAQSGWFCGDPGTQYDTNVNDWNTTPVDGRINGSNPCSEFMHLDGTACNLASLRAMLFADHAGKFDVEKFRHGVRIWQMILDITNCMVALPDAATAIGTFLYRDTGLGYADLGGILMLMGIPYDSDEGRAVAAVLTAIMHGEACLTSALMAKELGAYPRFWANKEAHLRVVRNHKAALYRNQPFEGVTVEPKRLDYDALVRAVGGSQAVELFDAAASSINQSYLIAFEHGYRNAQIDLLAPTGTIGILMDCDTTGVEPSYRLTVWKKLVGGADMTLTVKALTPALINLGYSVEATAEIVRYIVANDGKLPETMKPEHRKIFQTAVSDDPANPPLRWEAHLEMMAAVQPFLSGAISKTVNMPKDATIDDVKKAYRMGNDLCLKAVALYLDGAKLSQPIQATTRVKKTSTSDTKILDLPDAPKPIVEQSKPLSPPQLQKSNRMKLPVIRRSGMDVGVKCGDGHLYVRTSKYEDGTVGEIWITYSAADVILQAMIDNLCKTANVALQYGVPVEVIVRTWRASRFDPGVGVDHPNIKTYRSILDLAAKLIMFHELNDHGVCNVKPAPVTYDQKVHLFKDVANNPEAKRQFAESRAAMMNAIIADSEVKSEVVREAFIGKKCGECGNRTVVPSGATCEKCNSCGHSTGCG